MYEMIAALVATNPAPGPDHGPSAEDAFYRDFCPSQRSGPVMRLLRGLHLLLRRCLAISGLRRRGRLARGERAAISYHGPVYMTGPDVRDNDRNQPAKKKANAAMADTAPRERTARNCI